MKQAIWTALCALLVHTSVRGAEGTVEWVFVDESRGGRDIPCVVHYPAEADGVGAEPLPGLFPTVVFAHGFVMSGGDYAALVSALVAADFVVVTVESETGLAPDHAELGLDLAYVADAAAGQIPQLPTQLNDRVAIGGHSMGGGATWLAASSSSQADALFGLAPAETQPSAIAAAAQVTLPILVFSGTADAVTPPSDHHLPIYAASASACKARIDLTDGSHCGYADAGSLCDLGELFFNGMTRPRQQELTVSLLVAWLNHQLREAPWSDFDGQTASDFTTTTDCALSARPAAASALVVAPQPFAERTEVRGLAPGVAYHIIGPSGRTLATGTAPPSGILHLDAATWPAGLHLLVQPGRTPLRLLKSSH